MFASAAPLTFPPVIEPPIMTISLTRPAIEGSFETASAMFVSGPTGIKRNFVRIFVDHLNDESGPKRGSALHLEGGNSTSARPFFPCQNCAVINFWLRGCCAPPATVTSQRPASERSSAHSPNPAGRHVAGTTSELQTLNSGEFKRKDDGHGIVSAWICIDNHAPRCSFA